MEIKIKPLSEFTYNKYGLYQNMLFPVGQSLDDEYFSFYRDLIMSPYSGGVSFSICKVKKRPLVIDNMEYHNDAYETILPLDGDILLQVAPASPNDVFPVEQTEVFLVPKGTLILLRSGVWHHAPFAYNCDVVNVLIVLPERTYANDCIVKRIDDPINIVV